MKLPYVDVRNSLKGAECFVLCGGEEKSESWTKNKKWGDTQQGKTEDLERQEEREGRR